VLASRTFRFIAWGILAIAAWPAAGSAFTNVALGGVVDDAELRTLDGGKHRLFQKGAVANVVVFFRPAQEHSLDTLKELAACEKDFEGKKVHWVAIVSDAWAPEEVRAVVAESGIRMPVLWDDADVLYGKLGVRLHPVIGIFDGKRRLTAYEPFRALNYCDRVRARIQILLGELSESAFAKIDSPERSITRTDEGVARRHVNFARSLFRIHKNEKALAEVQRSLAVLPSAAAYALQGQILAADRNCGDALRAWDAALKLDPKNAEALEGKKTCGK
jgi:tetratricopeptide (TPR) repeat protein